MIKDLSGSGSRFLLMFFAPVALAIAAGGLFSYLSVSQFRDMQSASNTQQSQDLEILTESMTLTVEVLQVQKDLVQSIDDAAAGRVKGEAATALHDQIVERLTDMYVRLKGLQQSDTASDEIKGMLRVSVRNFGLYHNHATTSADMLGSDPKQAAQYVALANSQYAKYVEQSQKIHTDLALRSLKAIQAADQALDAFAKATKGSVVVPGVEMYEETSLASSSK